MNLDVLYSDLNGRFYTNYNVKKDAHYQIGGSVDVMAFPASYEDCRLLIQRCYTSETPCFIFGKGSNLLISDEGFRGIFIRLDDCCSELQLSKDDYSYVGAGIVLWDLIQATIEKGMGDMTNMSWIPGTVGGALFMNAGAFGTEIEEFVESVDVITPEGNFQTLSHKECGFNYRKSLNLQDKLILGATLKFNVSDREKMKLNSADIIARRQFKQPLEHPSCGSVFKRPPGLYAGTLIEECGLKGFSVGGAKVSEKHANFILNYNNAKASDVYQVIKQVQNLVLEKSGVLLEREVKLIGFENVDV